MAEPCVWTEAPGDSVFGNVVNKACVCVCVVRVGVCVSWPSLGSVVVCFGVAWFSLLVWGSAVLHFGVSCGSVCWVCGSVVVRVAVCPGPA